MTNTVNFEEMNKLISPYPIGDTFNRVLQMIEDEKGKQGYLNSLQDVTKYFEMYEALFKKYPYVGNSCFRFEVYEDGSYKRIVEGTIRASVHDVLRNNFNEIYAKPQNWELNRQANSVFKLLKKMKEEKLSFYETVDSLAVNLLGKVHLINGNNISHEEIVEQFLKYFRKGDMVSYLPIVVSEYLIDIRCVLPDVRLLLIARALGKYLEMLDEENYVLKKPVVTVVDERKTELELFITSDI